MCRGLYRTLKVLSRFHNVGKGGVNVLRVSGDGKYLAAGSDDGNVYLYPTDTSSTLLGKLALAVGSPVASLDFSADSRYMRVFGAAPTGDGAIKSAYYDFVAVEEGEVASAVGSSGEDSVLALRNVRWASCGSAAALEARCAHAAVTAGAVPGDPAVEEIEALPQLSSVCASVSGELLAAGYSDGSTQIFR